MMNVLVACEESQAVCKAFREKGHNAFSCDIQECSGGHPEWHIQGDVLEILNPSMCSIPGDDWYGFKFRTQDGVLHCVDGKWNLIIAHPPCTYMSNAGACRLYPKKGQLNEERYKKGLEAKDFFLRFINADCDKIAVENPIPSRVFELPKYTQIIQPYEYGHPFTKKLVCGLKTYHHLSQQKLLSRKDRMCAEIPKCGRNKLQTVLFTARKRAQSIGQRLLQVLPKQWLNNGGDVMMKYAEAIRISENPNAYTADEVGTAIAVILSMCTINAVKKENLLNLVRYMFDMCYEVKK